MRVLRNCLSLAATALLFVPQSALAREVAVAKVTPQGVACVFTPTCAVSVTDTVGYFKLFGNGGNGRLLTRTYPGMPGTQAAGLTGYSFYLDMRGATSLGSSNCVEKLVLDTGPLAALKYSGNATSEVFTVTGSSGAGLSSVSQSGTKLTFSFSRPICPAGSGQAVDSVYFGFAAKNGPAPGKGKVTGSLEGTAEVDARMPKR